MDKRVKQFADAIVPVLNIPEIFPSVDIDDFSKISMILEELLTQEETHTGKEMGVCKKIPVSITYVCGLDIIDINFSDLLKIINKENETESFVQYVQIKLKQRQESTERKQ